MVDIPVESGDSMIWALITLTRHIVCGDTRDMRFITVQYNTNSIRFSCWRHQMETFSASLALCAGMSPVNGEFPAQGFNDSKTFIWQRKYMHLDNNPSIFHFMRSTPISYNIHWGKHCGHWTSVAQLHMEGQSMLHFINAFRIDIFATSGDPY